MIIVNCIFDKGAKAIHGEKTVFSAKGAGISTCKKKKNLDTDLTSFTKINSKWITDLNVKCKTIKLLKDSIEENLDDLGYSDNF